jgi:hypothetical protein
MDMRASRLNVRDHDVLANGQSDSRAGQGNDPHSEDEERFIVVGLSDAQRVLVECHTYRGTWSDSSARGPRRPGSDDSMKSQNDDMAPEYDFSRGVKGLYAGRFYVDPATPPGTTVVLRRSIPEHHLQPGDSGHLMGAADELLAVEFTFGNREPVRVNVRPGDLRLLDPDEVLHATRTRAG